MQTKTIIWPKQILKKSLKSKLVIPIQDPPLSGRVSAHDLNTHLATRPHLVAQFENRDASSLTVSVSRNRHVCQVKVSRLEPISLM